MFWYLKNTWTIFWADLWLRQDEFHWSNDSLGPEHRNSFFYKRRLKQDKPEADQVVMVARSDFERNLLARREISHHIDDSKHPVRTFLYRQWAWFLYSRTGKLPSIVFNFK